jgi:hypothetical protein
VLQSTQEKKEKKRRENRDLKASTILFPVFVQLTKASGDCLITFLPSLPNLNSNSKFGPFASRYQRTSMLVWLCQTCNQLPFPKTMINTKPNKAKNNTKG